MGNNPRADGIKRVPPSAGAGSGASSIDPASVTTLSPWGVAQLSRPSFTKLSVLRGSSHRGCPAMAEVADPSPRLQSGGPEMRGAWTGPTDTILG